MAKILKQVQDDMGVGQCDGNRARSGGEETLQKENSRLATGEGMKVQALAMTQVLVLY